MKRYFSKPPLRWLLSMLLLAGALGDASAALGNAPSVAAPAPGSKRLAATAPASIGYTVQEVVLSTQTRVREYVNAEGIVFAVSWKGPVLPDFGALLGSYATTFQSQMKDAGRASMRRAPVQLKKDGLVLRSMGRMGNFFGSAYAPSLIPSGVSINDVLE